MSIVLKEDLVESFPNLEAPVFKRKIYDSCMLYAMENYKILRERFDQDMFPSESYYTIEDQLKGAKPVRLSGPPKKKRTPVRRSSRCDTVDTESAVKPNRSKGKGKGKGKCKGKGKGKSSEDELDEKAAPVEKKKSKSYPIIFNKNARTYIDFIVSRFLWELFSIESDDEWPENKEDIENFALTHAPENFMQCNITQLVIHSVRIFQPSKRIPNSHDLDRELRNKFDEYLNNVSVSNFASTYITDFLKMLSLFFSNKFWLEKSQTVNLKYFETVLRYIELTIPVECKTVSSGLASEMIQYDSLVNPVKTPSEKVTPTAKGKGKKAAGKSKKSPTKTSTKSGKSTKSKKVVKGTKPVDDEEPDDDDEESYDEETYDEEPDDDEFDQDYAEDE
jgi:hypothetical protein